MKKTHSIPLTTEDASPTSLAAAAALPFQPPASGTSRARQRSIGYRRLHVLLRREGYVVNHKRLLRLYREEKLAVRRRGGR